MAEEVQVNITRIAEVNETLLVTYATHPLTLPSFLPFPENPPLSSTPAH
jgi:hypothetical protein